MTLKIRTPVLLCLIAALLYWAAQQPPRAKREPVERTPKPDKPDGQSAPIPSPWVKRETFDPRKVTLLGENC